MRDGSVESVILTGLDRTERAEDRRRARASESTIRALLETAAQAILAVNQKGQIVFVNGITEHLFGYGHEELIGQTIEKLIPRRFREQHATHRVKWFAQPHNRQLGAQMEIFGLRKDGTEFPADVGLSYIDSADDLMGVAFVADGTERKRNEKALLDYQARLQNLTAKVMNVQEADNKALASELHDVYRQELVALGMEVSSLQASRELAGPLPERLAELGQKIGRLAEEMHGTSRRLHPRILQELGLETALREESDKFSEQTGIPVGFTCEKLPSPIP
jgi:PAS domain S-box-containing protein